MWTIQYKGVYIHGYCGRSKCRIHNTGIYFKSLHAAKIAITRGLVVTHPHPEQ